MAIEESKGKVIALSIVFPLFASSAVTLRFAVRANGKLAGFWLDDWLAAFGAVRYC